MEQPPGGSPIRLLQASYLSPKNKVTSDALHQGRVLKKRLIYVPADRNIVTWMIPYNSLDRAVVLHQASIRSRARKDLVNVQRQVLVQKSLSLLSKSKQDTVSPAEDLTVLSPASFKYFNSTIIPDHRPIPVSSATVQDYVSYLNRRPFK